MDPRGLARVLRARASSAFGSLSDRHFRRASLARSVSAGGSIIAGFAESWLLIDGRGVAEAAGWLGLYGLALSLPALLLGARAGLLVDRRSAQRSLVGAELAFMLHNLVLLGLWLAGGLEAWMLLVSASFWGVANAIATPARGKLNGELVPRERRTSALAVSDFGSRVAGIIGYPIAGVVLDEWGAAACWIIDTASSVVAALVLARIPREVRANGPRTDTVPAVRGALAVVRKDPALLIPVALLAFGGVLTLSRNAMGPVLAVATHAGPGAVAALNSALSIGGAIGAIVAAATRRRGETLAASVIAVGLFQAFAAIERSLWWQFAALVVLGACWQTFTVHLNAQMLEAAPRDMHGRILGLDDMTRAVAPLAGGLLLGRLAAFWSVGAALMSAGLVAALVGVVAALALGGPRRAAGRTFAPLSVANYRRYFGGEVIWLTCTTVSGVAEIWLLLELTKSVRWVIVGAVLFALPLFLVGLWAGGVVDRIGRRRPLLLLTLVLWLLRDLGIWWLCASDQVRPWKLCSGLLALGTIAAFNKPLRLSFLDELVGPERMEKAAALSRLGAVVAKIVAPAVAALVVTRWGYAEGAALSAIACLIFIAAIASVRGRELGAPPTPAAPLRRGQALQTVCQTPHLWAALACAAIVGGLMRGLFALAPLLATKAESAPGAYATVQIGIAVGSIVGTLLIASVESSRRSVVAAAAIGVGIVALVASQADAIPRLTIALAAVGALVEILTLGVQSHLLTEGPSNMRGHLLALFNICVLGSSTIGGAAIGLLIDEWSASVAIATAGALALATGLVAAVAFARDTPRVADVPQT